MSKNISYQSYQEYVANMMMSNREEHILDFSDWGGEMMKPIPEEFKSMTEEISYEEAERLGVVWTTEEELLALGIFEDE